MGMEVCLVVVPITLQKQLRLVAPTAFGAARTTMGDPALLVVVRMVTINLRPLMPKVLIVQRLVRVLPSTPLAAISVTSARLLFLFVLGYWVQPPIRCPIPCPIVSTARNLVVPYA